MVSPLGGALTHRGLVKRGGRLRSSADIRGLFFECDNDEDTVWKGRIGADASKGDWG